MLSLITFSEGPLVETKKKEVPKPTTQKKDETAKAGEKAEGSKGTTGNNNQGANKAE